MSAKEFLLAHITGVPTMDKKILTSKIVAFEDAIVTYRGAVSNKLKYNIVTKNFNCDYIKNKSSKVKETDNTVLVFCWDTDSFKLLKSEAVVQVVPLDSVLNRNGRNLLQGYL